MEIRKAVRRALPQIISIAGVSGSGKTYSALLMAAGLSGPGGKIGFLDSENGRGVLYSDSPGIMAALPQGYDTIELSAPFHPHRYIEAIDKFEEAGYAVLVIDSGSHAWEGEGGASDIAAADKGRWNKAKLANKRFVARLLNSSMHIIVCLRAREKSKIIPASNGKKEEVVSLGILPICEKNFPFEMLLSFMVEADTHSAIPVKVPEPLQKIFAKPVMITKAIGEQIREWNDTGTVADPLERLQRRAAAVAEDGLEAYGAFFKALPAGPQKKALADSTHEANKKRAAEVDAARKAEIKVFGSRENPIHEWPDCEDERLIWNGDLFVWNAETTAYQNKGPA